MCGYNSNKKSNDGFGSLLYCIFWLDVIYLAFKHILNFSFSIGICFGGQN
jgi:hypothetical protein